MITPILEFQAAHAAASSSAGLAEERFLGVQEPVM